jgi:hypothetical protein
MRTLWREAIFLASSTYRFANEGRISACSNNVSMRLDAITCLPAGCFTPLLQSIKLFKHLG